MTLLYAEDDPQSLRNYAFVLEEYFSKVHIAENGREALDLYHEKKPDVLLLDISMPYVDGIDVAKIVRETNHSIPIIMLTAHSEQNILFRAVNLKLEEYLLKPIDDEKLKKVILKVIQDVQNNDTISLGSELTWNKRHSSLLHQEKEIKLTKKEGRLMELLTHSIDEYILHDALIIQIWDDEIPDASHDNKLHQLIYRLNKKLNTITNNSLPLVENSYTQGYRIHNHD